MRRLATMKLAPLWVTAVAFAGCASTGAERYQLETEDHLLVAPDGLPVVTASRRRLAEDVLRCWGEATGREPDDDRVQLQLVIAGGRPSVELVHSRSDFGRAIERCTEEVLRDWRWQRRPPEGVYPVGIRLIDPDGDVGSTPDAEPEEP